MTPDTLLGIVAASMGFVLKTSLACAVCWLLSRLAGSPRIRFLVWLGFLYGAAAYWLWLADCLWTKTHPSAIAAGANTHHAAISTVAAIGAFQIPTSWAFSIGVGLRLLGFAYLLVLIVMLGSYIKGQRQLNWVLRFTSQPPAVISQCFRSIAENMHVSRSRLRVLSGISSPATFGWIRPTVLLPDVCLSQEHSELEDILRHELHHVRRHDFVWDGLAILCRALLFFHPAAWYAVQRIRVERELACDLAVVSNSPQGRARYAETLVHFARLNSSQHSGAWGIDFAATSDNLNARVRSILSVPRNISSWSVCMRIVGVLTLLIGFIGAAPTLAVLVSYAPLQTAQPATTSATNATLAQPEIARSSTRRRLRSSRTQLAVSNDVAPTSSTGSNTGASPPSLAAQIQSSSAVPSGPGPHLLRRGAESHSSNAKPNNQQTIPLIDPDGGQVTKSGDHDKKQALQQSATAVLGIYKRLSEVDRH